MKKNKRIAAVIAAIAVMLTACLSAAGCGDYSDMLQAYSQNSQPQETLAPDQSIYDLSMFQSLPQTYSDIDPAFWVAENNGGKVYFLGSIHCADTTSYRLPEKIMNAYLESDALAVECDIVAYEQDVQSNILSQFQAAQGMMYLDGSTLANHVSPELYTDLMNYYDQYCSSMASLGYTKDTLAKMKPAVWMSLFENVQIQEAGLDSELGIDSHLLKIAHAQGKQIIEIESVEFQNNMLFGFSDEVNEMLLESYVATPMPESAQLVLDSYHYWQDGDLDALMGDEEVSEEDYEGYSPEEIAHYEQLAEEYNNAMLYDRNVGMADKAQQMLDRGQNVFYVVGAAHMAGERGIIAMLRERGYTVTQIGGKDSASTYPGSSASTTTAASGKTTASTTAVTSAQGYNAVYESMYDEYELLYEYFGGTTRPKDDKDKTTASTSRTTTRTTDAQGGWGGWGSSDGTPIGGRGIFD